MHYAGILVAAAPERLRACAGTLAAHPGVQVHYCYPEQGRLILVLEAASVEDQQQGLRRIQEVPGVLYAELVYHYADSVTRPAVLETAADAGAAARRAPAAEGDGHRSAAAAPGEEQER